MAWTNKRSDTRRKVSIPVTVRSPENTIQVPSIIRNESRQGCMLVARCFEDLPDSIVVDFPNGRASVAGEVVWRANFTVGIRYTHTAAAPANGHTGSNIDKGIHPEPVADKVPDNRASNTARQTAFEAGEALEQIGLLQDSLYEAVASGSPLPKNYLDQTSVVIAESLKNCSIGSWLGTVKQYNSYTYRHCMTVSGIAVAFAIHLGFSDADIQRVATGGLIHDIGKVKIPIEVLDKPGKLTPEERMEINKHPVYGADILRLDKQFNDEVLDLTLHHHELLDGTGYPDGLTESQISDPVRILTIVDIYSALIDKRSYKEAMTASAAFEILSGMRGKLDAALVEAFEPVALAVNCADFTNSKLEVSA